MTVVEQTATKRSQPGEETIKQQINQEAKYLWLEFSSDMIKRAFGFSSPFDWLTDNNQAPQSIGKWSERKSDSHVKSSLSFYLVLFKAARLNYNFFQTFIAGPPFPEFYSSWSLQVIRFKWPEGAFIPGHM